MPFIEEGGRTLFFKWGMMPFVKEGCCLLSRMLFVERGHHLLREDTVHQDKDTVCQRGMEDTVS